jgi:hypothetical protein
LGAAIGSRNFPFGFRALRSTACSLGSSAVGIWSIVSLLISLFSGRLRFAAHANECDRPQARLLLNGLQFNRRQLCLLEFLVNRKMVLGTFGIAASNAGEAINQVQQQVVPNVNVPRKGASYRSAEDLNP